MSNPVEDIPLYAPEELISESLVEEVEGFFDPAGAESEECVCPPVQSGILMAVLIASIRHTVSSVALRVETDDAVGTPVAETLSETVSTALDYYVSGDDEADDYLRILEELLNNNTAGGVYTVSVSDDGRVTISCTRPFRLLWAHGGTTLDETYFGFTNATNPDPKTLTTTATLTPRTWWAPGEPVFRTDYGTPEVVGASERTLSGKTLTALLSTDVDAFMYAWSFLDQSVVIERFATDDPYNAFAYWFKTFYATGMPFRIYDNISDRDTFITVKKIDFAIPWRVEEDHYLTTFAVRFVAREVLA